MRKTIFALVAVLAMAALVYNVEDIQQLLHAQRRVEDSRGAVGAPSRLWGLTERVSDSSFYSENEKKSLSVLVTGGAGFIGYHTSLALHAQGHKVVGLDTFNDYYDPQLKRDRASQLKETIGHDVVVEGDVCDGELLKSLLEKHEVTHILHLAAQAGVRYSLKAPLAYVRANVECTTVLFEVVRKFNNEIPVVYASSSSVYGLNSKVPFSELDPVTQPASLYAATKRETELLAHVYNNLYQLKTVGLRFFTVYGPFGRPDMAYFSFSNAILAGKTIKIFNHGNVKRDFTYVDDIVHGIIAALKRAHLFDYEIFNLGNNTPLGVLSLVESLEKHLGAEADKEFTEQAKGDVLITYADVSKAAHLLDYAPVTSLDDGIKSFTEWYHSYYKTSERKSTMENIKK